MLQALYLDMMVQHGPPALESPGVVKNVNYWAYIPDTVSQNLLGGSGTAFLTRTSGGSDSYILRNTVWKGS